MNTNFIYLDNNATTKTDDRVVEAMLPYFSELYANASSSHNFGLKILNDIQIARSKVANLINAESSEIVFTSGGTESINIALQGFAVANQHNGNHIITIETEHKATLETCKYLESIGFDISYLPVRSDGLIDLNQLNNTLRINTILVCVMFVNNETGVILPIKEISDITHRVDAVFMCDATQAVGKIEVDVQNLGIDIMPFSAHKFYGPNGVGALYIKDFKRNRFKINPLIFGGGHENGLRSGTLNVPAIVGLGKACEIAKKEIYANAERIALLRDVLEKDLLKLPGSFLNGNNESRIYNVSNICFSGIDANILIGKMKNIAVATGSACSSALIKPSHVLEAMGLSEDDAMASIRFSLGKYNTEEEIRATIHIINHLLFDNTLSNA